MVHHLNKTKNMDIFLLSDGVKPNQCIAITYWAKPYCNDTLLKHLAGLYLVNNGCH